MPTLLALLLFACQGPLGADATTSLHVTGDDDDDTAFVDTGLGDDTGTPSAASPPPAMEGPPDDPPPADALGAPASPPTEREPSAPDAPVEDPVVPAPDAAPATPIPPVVYRLDPADSFLAVAVLHDERSVAGGLGHDHVLVAQRFRGDVTWTPDDPTACDIAIHFPVTALVVDPPGARGRAGLDPSDTVSEKKEAQILDNALGPKQLDAERFARIRYEASTCTPRGDGRYDVTGVLTIHGVAQTLTVPMAISDRGGFHATGTFVARASDFGFEPFRAFAGALRNQDRMRFVVDVRGT